MTALIQWGIKMDYLEYYSFACSKVCFFKTVRPWLETREITYKFEFYSDFHGDDNPNVFFEIYATRKEYLDFREFTRTLDYFGYE